MGAKKKKSPNRGTIFDDLEKEIEKVPEPVDLQSKILDYSSKRDYKRETLNGAAVIYDLRDKLLSKAAIRNLSLTGVSFEIWPVDVNPNEEVFVHFSSSINLGMVLCTVQWVSHIEGHRKSHKMVGLKFKKLTPLKQKRLIDYLNKIQITREDDPFYV
jgi:hypothetical protein